MSTIAVNIHDFIYHHSSLHRFVKRCCIRFIRSSASAFLSGIKDPIHGSDLADDCKIEWEAIFYKLPTYRLKAWFTLTRPYDALLIWFSERKLQAVGILHSLISIETKNR